MINRIVVGAHYGLKDWIAQRATAVVMAVYSAIIGAALLVLRPNTFEAWRALFGHGFAIDIARRLFLATSERMDADDGGPGFRFVEPPEENRCWRQYPTPCPDCGR